MQFDVRSFLIPLSVAFLNPKILAFLFSTQNRLTWGVNLKIELQKIVGNLLVTENSRQYLLLRTDVLQKTVVGSPRVLENLLNVPYDRPLRMHKRVNKTILPRTKMKRFFHILPVVWLYSVGSKSTLSAAPDVVERDQSTTIILE